jgi:hypothetical protein
VSAPLNPTLYPSSYRTPVWKGGLKVLGGMTLFCFYILAHTDVLYRGGVAPFTLLGALFLLLVLINVTFAKVTLYTDHIDRVTLFGTKTMLRADVVKLERRRRSFFKSLYLVSQKGLFEGVLLPSGIKPDAAWDAWMPAVQDDYVLTKRGARIAFGVMAGLVSFGCLLAALIMHFEVKRLATQTPVTATVAQVQNRMYKGVLVYSARLIFDRTQGNGSVVHCDLPDVELGVRSAKLGETIKISPQNTSCFAPDIICDTCAAPSDAVALDLLIIAVACGLICFLLFWITSRERNEPGLMSAAGTQRKSDADPPISAVGVRLDGDTQPFDFRK